MCKGNEAQSGLRTHPAPQKSETAVPVLERSRGALSRLSHRVPLASFQQTSRRGCFVELAKGALNPPLFLRAPRRPISLTKVKEESVFQSYPNRC